MGELTVVKICAGAGGQALGLEQAGFSHAAAIEFTGCRTCTCFLTWGCFANMCGTWQFPTLGIHPGDARPHVRGKIREYLPL